MKRPLLLWLIFSAGLLSQGFGQGALVWHLGDNGRIDFLTDPPTADCSSNIIASDGVGVQEGTAGVTTTSGQDVFYTSGVSIWDADGNIMPGANDNLYGGSSSATSALIVPDPGDSLRYYVFTVDAEDGAPEEGWPDIDRGINYTIVDLSLPGNGTVADPKGDVVTGQVNVQVMSTNIKNERLTSVPKADGSGYWIITFDITSESNPRLVVMELTETGLSGTSPNFTRIQDIPMGNNTYKVWSGNFVGTVKASVATVDGTNVRVAFGMNGRVWLFNFNPNDASISDFQQINNTVYNLSYGLEFSPDGQTLYASNLGPDTGGGALYKYNLSAANIPSTESLVWQHSANVGNVQMGPDGKIYVAYRPDNSTTLGKYLGVINDPDNYASPDFAPQGLEFDCPTGVVYRGLPTFVPAIVANVQCQPPASAEITEFSDFCQDESTTLEATLEQGFNYYWINGTNGDTLDWGFEQNTFSTSESGEFRVLLASPLDLNNTSCSLLSDAVTVTEQNTPVITGPLVGNTPICRGSASERYSLQNDPGYASYSWNANNGALSNQNTSELTLDLSGVATASSVTVSLVVEETIGSATCESEQFTQEVLIEDAIVFELNPNPAEVACNSTDNTISIENTYNADYSYTVTSSDAGISVDEPITSEEIFFSVQETSGSFEILGTSPNGCATTTIPVDISVLGCGLTAIFDNDTICSGDNASLDGTSSVAGNGTTITDWEWILPSEISGSPVDQSTFSGIGTNSGDSNLMVDVQLVVTNSIGMTDTTTQQVVIKPLPGDHDILTDGAFCENSDITFWVAPDDGTRYTWRTDPGQSGVQNGDSATYSNGVEDYTVFVLVELDGCTDAEESLFVDVEELPKVSLAANEATVLCESSGNTIAITNYNPSSEYIVSGSAEDSITAVEVDGIIEFDVKQSGGLIYVTEITSPNNCESAGTPLSISVIGCTLTANFSADEPEECSSDTVIFTSNSDPGDTTLSIDSYQWIFPQDTVTPVEFINNGKQVVAVVNNPSNAALDITVGLIIENSAGQFDTTFKASVLTINPLPFPFAVEPTGSICEGNTMEFDLTPYQTGVNYDWSATDARVETINDTSAFVVNGTSDYEVTVTASIGDCEIDTTLNITIELTPDIGLNTQDLSIACLSDDSTLTISPYDETLVYSFSSTGDAVIDTVGNTLTIDAGTESGEIRVWATSSNACVSDTVVANYDIFGCAVIAQFDTEDDPICANETITLNSTSFSLGGTEITDYDWTFNPREAIEYVSDSTSQSIQVRLLNSGTSADSIEVILSVTNAVGISDDTSQTASIIALPFPPVTGIAEFGGSCPGDTSSFIPDNYFETVSYNWSHSNLDATVVETGTDSFYQVVNGNTNDIISLDYYLYPQCPLNVTTTRVINQLPSKIQGIFGSDDVCHIGSKDSLYQYSIAYENADSISWYTATGDENFALFSNQDQDTTFIRFPEMDQDLTVMVDIINTACASATTLELPIFTNRFYDPSAVISNEAICEEDDRVYYVALDILDDDGGLAEVPEFTWYLNGDTLEDKGDSLYLTDVTQGDSVALTLDYNTSCIYYDAQLTQSWNINVVDRPGALLSINGDIEEHYLTDILELSDISLRDSLWYSRQFSGDPQPITHNWYWYNTDVDSLVTTGIPFPEWEVAPVSPFPSNTATPPLANATAYDVTYYLVAGNGVCYDTSTAVLHIDFDIWIPSAFSPNNDGSYNTWDIRNLEKFSGPEIEVYNRWGNLVYESRRETYEPWDGTRNGEELPVGTYFYILKLTEGDTQVSFTGDVSILR